MRILLLTRSYPRDDDLYQYPFVHRRVLAYRENGHDVHVVCLGADPEEYVFDGVQCRVMRPPDFAMEVAHWKPDVVAVHGLDEHSWAAVADLRAQWPVCAWLHGSEIPAFYRDKASRIPDRRLRQEELSRVEGRAKFWRDTLGHWPDELSLAFVSHYSIELMRHDLGDLLRDDRITVIHNPIETELFHYATKSADDRYNILSIRPYVSPSYGNDLAVDAVLGLTGYPHFERAQFTFVGDGPLFDEVLGPLKSLPNVTIKRQFLRQSEIAEMHRRHGIFLVPTRLDTQGVSRDEAMASGLVPATNAVCSIPEFVDEDCGILAGPEDGRGLANGIARLFDNPHLFLEMSANAAKRVRRQSSSDLIIPQELAWMEGKARAAS